MTASPAAPPPMTCADVVRLVTDYFEGALSTEDRARFDSHIMKCDGCSGHLSQLRATMLVTGRLRETDVSPAARAALLEAFRDWETRPPARSTLREKLLQFFKR